MEIDNLLENISIVSNDTINTIELKEFPKEGCCKTDQIELRDYLKNKFPQYIQKSWRSYYNIVAWNEIGYWFCEEKSSKPEYQLSQLQKFFTKDEVKQPLKQAVHCTTQEEWDFVLSKLPKSSFLSKQSDKFTKYNDQCRYEGGIAVNINGCAYSDIEWYKNEGYQILSFQEWCNLNGYKMEKEGKFEVGKWYRVTDGTCKAIGKNIWYVKSPKLIKGIITCEEHIYHKINKGGDFGRLGEFTFTEVSNKEIQQYLSDDHPDKIKSNQEFKVGDYIILENAGGWNYSSCNNGCLGLITKISNYKPSTVDKYICSITGDILNSKNKDTKFEDIPVAVYEGKWIVRHATPEEINNHLISIGQIPIGELLNTGIEPNKNGSYSCISINRGENPQCTFNSIKLNGQEILKPKMILSIDDEELPMVNIIKTNTVKQLLNVE